MPDTTPEQKTRKPFIETIAELLTNDEWEFHRGGKDGNALYAYVRGDRATYRWRFVVEEEDALVTFLVFGPTEVPDDARPQVLELLNLMNSRYMIGNFELNVAQREVIFRVGYDLEDGALSSQMIHNMMRASVSAYDKIFPALMAVCYGGASAASALVSAGGKDSDNAGS